MLVEAVTGFFGLVFGFLLQKVTKEEIEKGKKYFVVILNIFLIVLAIVLLIFNLNFLVLIFLFIGVILGSFFKRLYFYLGLILISSKELFFLSVVMIFLISLLYGSLSKFKVREFIFDLVLYLLPLVLIIGNFINAYSNIFLGIAIGGIISQIKFLNSNKKMGP